ncbi:glutathione S-transferase N-terminal domain-containing protein [Rheinheimera salexigens]|uniref:Glutaredoxin n=1 Tax=Rheinheimera salexigens TaxID=1628148 RepID=A0A1E7Q664_9GAMM|nr:glutathione S-transferase N-terminal domain-containing protein [Rheinheimera salexigens]OEY69669.1 glutaredoxin [Rheinheimera salexigens]
MRFVFKLIRMILTPFMLLAEKLTTPKGISRSMEAQTQVNADCSKLALYEFKACPFCIKVRKEMARLNLSIIKYDAQNNQTHRQALQAGGGRIKVPCLRITQDNGDIQWMYESKDIITYLQQRFAAV